MDAEEEEDWLPSDFEVILGSLTILIRDQKDTEKIIEKNSKEIADRFRKEVLGTDKPDCCTKPSEKSTEIVGTNEEDHPLTKTETETEAETEAPAQPQSAPQPPQNAQQTSPQDEPIDIPEDMSEDKEVNPLLKKLFKPIAVICHPDKVADKKLHKFFLIGRKAYDDQDFSMLLYILARIRAYDIELEATEISEIREHLSKKQNAVIQMKESLPYKWSFLREEDKATIIKNIRVMGAQHQNSNTV
jgi:hypothetical protein